MAALREAIDACALEKGKPHCIVMDTVKGAGIPEVENTEYNHSMNRWLEDLHARLAALTGGEDR